MRYTPYIRLVIFAAIAFALGLVVQQDPGQQTLTITEKGVSITVPRSLEGWHVEQGKGDVLATAATRLGTMSVEMVEVPVTSEEQLAAYMKERHLSFSQGKPDYIVWHEGLDYKFGLRYALAYKATYTDRFLGLPIDAEYWQQDVYWPYKDHYVRIGLRYPDFLARYIEPDRMFIAAGIKLAK